MRKIWRRDEASEQLRELTTKWKSWIGSDTFENSMGCGNEGDVYSAGSNDFLRRNIPDLESLIPAVERLERAEWEGRLDELELCADSTIPILEWYGRRKPYLLQKLGGDA